MNWKILGMVDPDQLHSYRHKAHAAVQILKAVSAVFTSPQPGDSHLNMSVNLETGTLLTIPFTTDKTYTIGLGLRDFTLEVWVDDEVLDRLILEALTIDEAVDWLKKKLVNMELAAECIAVDKDFSSDIQSPFQPEAENIRHEFADYFINAFIILKDNIRDKVDSGPIICRPDQFDVSTRIHIDKKSLKWLDIGMSPGDEYYAEPYFYVIPYPGPHMKSKHLYKDSTPGAWHNDEWFGIVLGSKEIVKINKAGRQGRMCRRFLENAQLDLEKIYI